MGDDLTQSNNGPMATPLPPWLDSATAALADDIVHTLAKSRRDLLAIILYGSIARHDERPIEDTNPSDVDLLAIFDTADEDIAIHQGKALFTILGQAYDRHLDISRDVKVMFASRNLGEWDVTFIANVARDGVLLWASGPLPDALADVVGRVSSYAERSEIDPETNAK